jgi:hypothetical protein
MHKHILLILSLLALVTLCQAQWLIDEDFDDITSLPAGWTIHDDGDGMVWRNLNNASHAHSGTRAAFCDNYMPNENADWLITPQLNVAAGDSLVFYTRSWVSTEPLKVYVSTTGTAVSNFTAQIMNLTDIGTTYQREAFNLSSWAGQNIYIGFLWNCENYGILLDDIRIGHPLIIQPALAMPDNFSFIQGETLTVDFTPYITCTDIGNMTLAASGNVNVNIQISGTMVTFSAPAFNGSETVTFTLTDGVSGLTATDIASIDVLPVPATDMGITAIASPREFEYLNHAFTPSLTVQNAGTSPYDGMLGISCLIQTSVGVEVYYNNDLYPVQLQPGQSTEVTLNTSCSPTAEGGYSAVFNLTTDDGNPVNNTLTKQFTVVNRITQGGPDTFGYSFIDSNDEAGPEYEWIDISATGTSTIMYNVPTWGGDDNFSEAIPMGFSFPFYGMSYTQMYVDINGEILLAPNSWQDDYPSNGWDGDGNMFNYMYPLPGYATMPALISVYWDDLYADQGVGDIYFQTFGETPNRYTVVQWNNLRFLAGTGGSPSLKFQVILHENGEILMQYNTTQTGQSGSTVPHQNGRSATVGIQNEDTTAGLCYMREIVVDNQYQGIEPAGNLLHDGLAIRFYTAEDNQAPILTHATVGNTFDTTPSLKVNAIDLSDITDVTLHYNTGGAWQTLDYTSQEGHDYLYQLPELPLGAYLNYYFSGTDSEGNTGTLPTDAPSGFFSFKILPSPDADVLIAYSGRQDYQLEELPIYVGLMEALDMEYDVYNWEEYDSYRFPIQYDAILCYATVGSHSDRTDTLSIALMQYLDSGTTISPKNLFFASDGFASSTHANPNSSPIKKLMDAYFRSYYVATGFGGGTNGLAGPDVFSYENGSILCYENSPIGNIGSEYPVYANTPDCIFRHDACPDWYASEVQYPEVGAQSAFLFEDGPVGGQAFLYHGVCATSVNLPISKTFYFSFDYSQLTDSAQRYALMSDLMDWFGVSGVPVADDVIPSAVTGITGNYPNPFNPSTTISFSVRESSRVRLEIYNTRGQKVRTLVDGILPAGSHSILWDGTDARGGQVSSSMYIVRINDGIRHSERKIMLIK